MVRSVPTCTHTQAGASEVNVSIGDALVVVSRSPWHLSVYDNASKQLVLDEVGDEEYRLVSSVCVSLGFYAHCMYVQSMHLFHSSVLLLRSFDCKSNLCHCVFCHCGLVTLCCQSCRSMTDFNFIIKTIARESGRSSIIVLRFSL